MIRERWRLISDAIGQDIKNGALESGAKLPTEAELVAIYGTGRHSIRCAVAELTKTGFLRVEQGRGTFVQPQPMIDYAIGKRTRLRRNLQEQGVDVGGELLGSERVPARGRAAKKLGLDRTSLMIVTRRITYADGVPVSLGALYHDAARFVNFPDLLKVLGSVSQVYKSCGIEDYIRGNTTLHARPAKAAEAKSLQQHKDLPVMVVRKVDTLLDGTPIAFGEVIWSASRVKFSISNDKD